MANCWLFASNSVASSFDLRGWAEGTLIRAGAARRCPKHNLLHAASTLKEAHKAIAVARLNHLPGITADGAELAVLEVYVTLPDHCERCEGSVQRSPVKAGGAS